MARGYPDFEGGKSKLFNVADWSAIEATDKNLRATAALQGGNAEVAVQYTVPALTTLYIIGFAFKIVASLAADRDNNQFGSGYIQRGGTLITQVGGNGGGAIVFNKPQVFTTGVVFRAAVAGRANHLIELAIEAWGYEI